MKHGRPHGIVKAAKKTRAGATQRRRSKETSEPENGTALRERVLNAAFSAFVEKGYEGTSTLEIATRAKVSKRELYQVCSGKSALLKDAITERARRMRLPLELPQPKDRAALAVVLSAFGAAVLRGVCDPAVQGVYRLAIAEAAQAPEVAHALQQERAASRVALTRMLREAKADGLIGNGDPAEMVVEFFALLWGDLLVQLLLRVAEAPGPAALERKAREATERFLSLYPEPRSSPREPGTAVPS